MIVVLVLLAVVLAILLGVAVIGLALKLLWWALVGLAIGLLGRLILPGGHVIGWIGTIAAGIGGAILGGVVGDAFDLVGILQFVLAVLFAALLIAVFAGGTRREYA
jgi:uncharacterized membrane protein YeaQ/YmgE (transglycosylase-associated protein family)